MERNSYKNFVGVKAQFNPIDAPQNSYLLCDNFVLNREFGALVKRGGTENWSITGDIYGLGGYVRKLDSNLQTPIIEYPIQHRRDGATSYFEYLDWATNTWTTITQGTLVTGNVTIGGLSMFAQQDDLLCVCASLPCKLTAYDGDLEKLGGAAPTAKPTVAAGSAGALTSSAAGYRWEYTFYNSTTGWESSPSPTSDFLVLTSEKADLSGLETTVVQEGVDQKRIYRTIETGEDPFQLVTTIPIAQTTYTDNTADADLGVSAPSSGDHNPPPTPSYICEAFENRLWIASGSSLYYSNEYAGNNVNLEYFSENRKYNFSQRITGLAKFNQRLMVFFPPKFGITQIRKQTNGEFTDQRFHQTEGTNWPHSVTVHDQYMAYWGATGPSLFDKAGPVERFDEDIRNFMREILVTEYTQDVFVWSVYHEETEQFLFGLAGNVDESMWQQVDSLTTVSWFDVVTGADVNWEEVP